MFLLVDDFSRYMWTFMLKLKSEAFETFKRFKVDVESDAGVKIKCFRTDRGGEFTSREFNKFCENEGIKRQLTAPYTPQQNGVVERRNRTILGTTRTMLKAKNVPAYMWGEAIRHATYVLNRVITRAVKNKTPYEAFKGVKPNVEHLKVFGCLAYNKVPKFKLDKLEDRSSRLVYLGTESSEGTIAHRLFDPIKRQLVIGRNVDFNEEQGWKWNEEDQVQDGSKWDSFTVDLETDAGSEGEENANDLEEQNVQTESNGSGSDAVAQNSPGFSPAYHPTHSGVSLQFGNTPSNQIQQDGTNNAGFTSRRSMRPKQIPKKYDDFILDKRMNQNIENIEEESYLLLNDDEPRNFQEASKDQEWVKAMKIEMNSIERNKTWFLTDLPVGSKAIGLKWVFKVKRNADGSLNKYKARLVAKGYVQQYGTDYDEVFAPVTRIETVRLLIAIAASEGWEVHHLDVKSAFLHGDLKETVYVNQPDGFEKKNQEQKVYKLKKALYGLKQAPRAWNAKLDETLKQLKFTRCLQDQAVYTRATSNNRLIIGVYVDDLIVTGTTKEEIYEFKQQMANKFEMSDLGKLTYYLGIEVCQDNTGIMIKQESYASKILKEARMETCNPSQCPLEPGIKLSKDEEGEDVDATSYRRQVGCLRYLLHTRPDLSFSVGLVSCYMQSPKQSHTAAIKQILRYIRGTMNFGIRYGKDGTKELNGFSDSSHSVGRDDGRSTTGHVFYYGNCPITWCSQKQQTVALSSCEAEFMAATSAACQALWLRELLSEITGCTQQRVVLRVDNLSAIALMKNPVFHGRSKHINTRYHFIRECVERDQVKVEHVSGDKQRADILTKALARISYSELKASLFESEIRGVIVGPTF
ncbi:putative RNA-directed DNA polymerase [Helianthus annuus]|nr:putative RNA-directed DNA polymerase [Helianthus annuus]